MKWVAIAGTWRTTNGEVEADVRREVARIMVAGDGIVTGGALGVDYIATDEAFMHDPNAERIKIFIPSTLERYAAHYRTRAKEAVITSEQAEALIAQLERVRAASLAAIIEGSATTLDKSAYFDRITKIVEAADELVAFHVNQSEGTQDTVDKAEAKGIPVTIHSYTI